MAMLTVTLILSATAIAAVRSSALDPARCGARFLLRRGSIIRTEESRALGARYLTELDVGARRECTTLCCETDLCDVFVYEEKGAGAGAGSCYLFACGSAGDFRCKFAPHGNFTSGLLRTARPLAELQDMQQLDDTQPSPQAKHLTLPSHAGDNSGMSAVPALAPVAAPPPPPTPSTTTSTTTVPSAPVGAGCSRYQFACRSGDECIAVYNACDGVPQCADHSDEAPELGCPPSMPLTPSTTTTIATPPQPAQTYRQTDDWPHRLAQAQPQLFAEGEIMGDTPRIFSHTGGLLQTSNAQPPPPAVWQPQAVDGGWGYAGGWRRPSFAAPAQSVNSVMPVMDGYNYERMVAPVAPELAAYGAPAPVGGASHDSAKKAPPTDPPTTTTAVTKPPPTKAPTVGAAVPVAATGNTASGPTSSRHWAADKHDGLSERTPAAVFLLVLGVLMWVGVCAVVGGRLRSRRHRRKPLAHDADYLVNGMYL